MTTMKVNSKTIPGLFLAGLMIFTVFGVALSYQSTTNTENYKGFVFEQTQTGWSTEINGKGYGLYTFPGDIDSTRYPAEAVPVLQHAKSIVVTYSDEREASTLAQLQYYMEQTISQDLYFVRALINESEVLPQLSCTNSTPTNPIIVLAYNNQTSVTHQNGCVTLTGANTQELVRLTDKTIYILLGVMNE
jgi:hypothetical protein